MIQPFCHICKSRKAETKSIDALDSDFDCNCPTCGQYYASQAVLLEIDEVASSKTDRPAILSYAVRRMQRGKTKVRITQDLLQEFLKRSLPTAEEQADNFILFLGDHSYPGQLYTLDVSQHYPLFGANGDAGLHYIIRSLKDIGLLENDIEVNAGCLTFAGWKRYQELKKGHSQSKKAFMAMAFGNAELDELYESFKSALKATGFNLTRWTKDQKLELSTIGSE